MAKAPVHYWQTANCHAGSGAQASFGGWVGFAQAANAEPSWVVNRPERVRAAEQFMRKAGYEIGEPTEKGGRRWVAVERRPRFGTFRVLGLKISV